MENNIINVKLKRIIYYLNKIGLLSEEDNLQIINLFFQLGKFYLKPNSILFQNFNVLQNYFKENIIKTITLFLNSLTEDKSKKISINIYRNYIESEKILNTEKIYSIITLFQKLKLKRAFRKICFFSKNKYDYNFLYEASPNISSIASEYSNNKYQKLKTIPYYTRNMDNNSKLRLSNIEKINKIINKNNHSQYETNIISNISDLGISLTFSKENSPFIKTDDLNEKNITENNINHASYKQILFSNENNKLFNKKKPSLNLKLTPHFQYLGKPNKIKKEKIISKENTTEYKKEQEEIKHCTFKPKINKINKKDISDTKSDKINNERRIEKLYLDNQRKIDKRIASILLRDNRLSKENTFKPKFVSTSVKKMKKNFSLRMNKFNKLKEEKKKKLMKSIEQQNSSIYTFYPKLNNGHNSNNNNRNKKMPAYERLYSQNKYLKRKLDESSIDQKSLSMNNKSVDYQKIQKLYEEYKILKQKRKNDQKNLDKERGLTFNPLLINQKKYKDKITPGFFEREKKFVEEQKNHIDAYKNFLNKEKEKYFKRFTEDKKIIVKNVVNRLYNEGLYNKRNNNNLYSKTENNNNISDNFDGKESIIITKSNKSIESLNKNENNNLKNNLSNNEIQISIKSSENFSLSQLINDKN